MPFLEDTTSPDESMVRSPIWSAVLYVKENLEKLVVVNLAWSVHFLPAILALFVPHLWLGLRVVGFLYTATVLAAATGVMYGVVRQVCESEPASLEMVQDTFRALAVPSMRALAPLYGVFTISLGLCIWGTLGQVLFLQVLGGYLTLLLLLLSLYWGPTFAAEPTLSSLAILRRSVLLVWRYPLPSLLSAGVIALILFVSIASIAGFFFIVPVVVAVLQTCRYRDVMARVQAHMARLRRPA